MQASQARWAVVTFCMLGSLGCQGGKSWWPGQKPLPYSQSSANPPAVQQQAQQYQQAPAYDQAAYGQSQGAAVTPAGYGANGYQVGANPQDPYGMAAQGAPGANAYGQAYAGQQPTGGAYPEQLSNANPYGQPGAGTGGYGDPQAGYGANPGYQQSGANPYGAAGGYNNQMRTADARTGGGYATNGPYDAGGYGGPADQAQYGQGAGAGGPPIAGDPYQPGQTGYQPGQTGYNPQGTSPYQVPGGAYQSDPNAAGTTDAPYRPGSTKDFAPTSTPGAADYGQPPATSAPAGYNTSAYPGSANNTSAYPNTAAASGSYGSSLPPNASGASPALDRYGRPVQQASGRYPDPTLQR